MKTRAKTLLLVGVILSPILSGCVADDTVEPSPADTDVDQYLNPPDASERTEADNIDRANRQWLDKAQQNSQLDRHR